MLPVQQGLLADQFFPKGIPSYYSPAFTVSLPPPCDLGHLGDSALRAGHLEAVAANGLLGGT